MEQPFLGEKTRRRLQFLINFVFFALLIALLLLGGRMVIRFLMPFVTAFLLAFLLQKPIQFLKKKYRFTHPFAAGAVLSASLSLIGGGAIFCCWQIVLFLIRLLRKEETLFALQTLGSQIRQTIILLTEKTAAFLPAEFTDFITRAVEKAEQILYESGASLLSSLSGNVMGFLVGAFPRFLLATVFFTLSAVFFTRDFHKVISFFRRQIPEPQRPLVNAALAAVKDTVKGACKAYIYLFPITFFGSLLGFWTLKISSPFLLALVTAFIDILPVLGAGTILLPMGIFYLFTDHLFKGVGLLVLYGLLTALRNFLQPRLLSKQTGLPPLLTLLSMYGGWKAAGFLGLLSAPILTMVLLRLQKEGYLKIFK
jgi:sporulation integral membrane protein YtvI